MLQEYVGGPLYMQRTRFHARAIIGYVQANHRQRILYLHVPRGRSRLSPSWVALIDAKTPFSYLACCELYCTTEFCMR